MLFRIIFSLAAIVTASIAMGGVALASATSGGGNHIFNLAVSWAGYAALAIIGIACAFVIVEEISHTRNSKK